MSLSSSVLGPRTYSNRLADSPSRSPVNKDLKQTISMVRPRGKYKKRKRRVGKRKFKKGKKRKRVPFKPEVKKYDETSSFNVSTNNNKLANLTEGLGKGTNVNQRIGNKVLLFKLKCNLFFQWEPGGNDENEHTQWFRVILFKWPGGETTPTVADILEYTGTEINRFLSPYTIKGNNRYKILRDTHLSVADGEVQKNWTKKKINLKATLTWDENDNAAKNHIYLLITSVGINDTDTTIENVDLISRAKFTDS